MTENINGNIKEELTSEEETAKIIQDIDNKEEDIKEDSKPKESIAEEKIKTDTAAADPVEPENPNKIKQELIYGKIVLSDRVLFADSVDIKVKHEKEYNGDIVIITMYDISEKDLKKIRGEIASNKAKYHTKRTAKNTGTTIAGVTKGLFGGIKGFGKGVAKSFKQEMKKIY